MSSAWPEVGSTISRKERPPRITPKAILLEACGCRVPIRAQTAATTGASSTSKAPSAEAYQLAGKVKPRISVRALVDASRIIVEYAWKRMKLKTTEARKSTMYGRSRPRSAAVTRGLLNITQK